ncbi:hypothetical protein Lal_00006110 [Lupinus albus]|nr:hypothetical protein Lal_00006110 [Lupinus albus]
MRKLQTEMPTAEEHAQNEEGAMQGVMKGEDEKGSTLKPILSAQLRLCKSEFKVNFGHMISVRTLS